MYDVYISIYVMSNFTVNDMYNGEKNTYVTISLSADFLQQATGLDSWTSRVKCPARFVSHLHDISIYMSCL